VAKSTGSTQVLGLRGDKALLAAVIERGLRDALLPPVDLSRPGSWERAAARESAWSFFAGAVYPHYLELLDKPPWYLPAALEVENDDIHG
jgi:hypothetical protein